MNVFTTDHPFVSQSSFFDARKHPLFSFLKRTLVVALVLCPLFVGIVWFAMLNWNGPDVPDPSWMDPLLNVVGFLIAFPVFFIVQANGSGELLQTIFILFGVAVDGLFWAFLSAALYQVPWRNLHRRLCRG